MINYEGVLKTFINKTAEIDLNVSIGNFTSIMKNVKIGSGTVIGNCVSVNEETVERYRIA